MNNFFWNKRQKWNGAIAFWICLWYVFVCYQKSSFSLRDFEIGYFPFPFSFPYLAIADFANKIIDDKS